MTTVPRRLRAKQRLARIKMRRWGIYAPDGGYHVDLKKTDVQATWRRHGWAPATTRTVFVEVQVAA